MRLVFFAGYMRNRRQLCRELALEDGETEQAVLEAAYSRWGERLADHLYGGFAFVFENPESGTLFCVRDQFGLQPFFYMVTGKGELLYGSDINGLVRDPRCRRSVDPEAIQYYMCFGYPAGEKTIWKGIRKLMPGQTLTFRDGKASVSTYYQKAWTPEYECTEEEWTGRIGETLARIIREDRENVDFRSASSFLSGGVDSSYLLAVSGVSRAVGIGYPGENASETFRFEDYWKDVNYDDYCIEELILAMKKAEGIPLKKEARDADLAKDFANMIADIVVDGMK